MRFEFESGQPQQGWQVSGRAVWDRQDGVGEPPDSLIAGEHVVPVSCPKYLYGLIVHGPVEV